MLFITCSGKDHYFNNIIQAYTHIANPDYPDAFPEWDRKCDCGKKKLAKKEVKKFLEQFNPLTQRLS